MSKNSFKVKNGLTLNPIDPSEIVNPQAGDLIADSTDDNKIKRYDATSADWSSVGGSAGIGGNLMSEFEKLTPDLVNVTSAVDTVTFLPIDDNNKSIKATWSGSVGSIQFQIPVDSSLHEIQGTVSVWIKTSLDNIQVSSVQDDVKLSTLPVSGTGKWKQYELPVVVGGAEMGFIVESTTGVTGDVYIDQPFVGLTPSSYGFEVAQTEYLGRINYAGASGCVWTTSSTTFSNFTADADCNLATVINGSLLQAPSTKIPAVVLPAGSPAGIYKFVSSGFHYKTVTDYGAYRFSDGTNHSQETGIHLTAQTIGTVVGEIAYSQALTSDTTVQLQARNNSGAVEVYANTSSPDYSISVYYYPPKSTIVTETQEETVQTANEFSAKISATGVVTSENLDWIDGNCTMSNPVNTCQFKPNIFTVAPNCVVTHDGNDLATLMAKISNNASNASQVGYVTQIAGANTYQAGPVNIVCQKQGADYNKSRLIVGQFEQIKSTELCTVEAYGNDGEAITVLTEDIPFKTKIKDNCNAWSNAGNTGSNTNDAFTPIRSGYYLFNINIRTTTNITYLVDLYENGVEFQRIGNANSSVTTVGSVSTVAYLTAGNVYTIRTSNGNQTLEPSNSTKFHKITITELPSIAAIVKNLNDNRNVKCQTKYLSASVTTTGIITSLNFDNLDTTKYYSLQGDFQLRENSPSSGDKEINIDIEYGSGTDIKKTYSLENSTNYYRDRIPIQVPFFKPLESSIRFNVTFIVNAIIWDSTGFNNSVTLCELPDYYIETDEW